MFFISYNRSAFRNFATSIESQDLMDDLTENPRYRDILKRLYYPGFDPGEKLSPLVRILKRSLYRIIEDEINSKFNPANWFSSRYSNGEWAVLYTAETEETALREALFHVFQFYQEEISQAALAVSRRVVRLHLASDKGIEVLKEKKVSREALVSKDESGYPYCRKLAKTFIDQGAHLLRVPSARHAQGWVVPVFEKKVVKKDEGHLKYLRCLLTPEGSAEVTGIIEEEKKIYRILD